ncbi:MAG: histidinol-phosphatase HisJ family protein [Oscillospiraceae bacterium]|nr:histidinol-phosphatase HisJ family protein [Oscillospiraceae bacterium]
MFKADHHIHSYKSFDAEPSASIAQILKTAAEKNINQIALCDHYDVNWIVNGSNPDIDFQDTLNQIKEAKKNPDFSRTEFLLGIELGQPNQCPEKAAEVLTKNDFDFILCALHNARNEEDFYYIDYKSTDIPHLTAMFERYANELCELAEWGNFHSLAHITYPVRYFLTNDIHISMNKYNDLYKKLFEIIIRRGIALEVNTSGLRKQINEPSPSFELLRLYKSVGGELITVGSDAHSTADIFSGIEYAYERLSEIGFKYISVIGKKDKKLVQVKIER